MRREQMLEVLRARPFRPFRMHVSDGKAYDIRHPEIVMVARTYALVGLLEPEKDLPAIEKHSMVDLLHITRLEGIDAPASA